MADPKPNFITMCNEGKYGDREFVVSCKGRPFAVLTAPLFPVPAFTMVDLNLIRDLNIRMTDMQCTKLFYGGQKLRICGKVSTTVQCIINGAPAGTMHFKAHVVQDLYKLFDTHSIAGTKLSQKLLGPPVQFFPDKKDSAEPTEDDSDAPEAKKKKRKKVKKKTSLSQATKSPKLSSCEDSSPTPPDSRYQGQWIQHYSYQGWHPEHGYGRPDVLRCYYEDRSTGKVQNDMPDEWDSDGTLHSLTSMKSWVPYGSSDTDEYGDTYINLSSVRYNDPETSTNPTRRPADEQAETAGTNISMQAMVHKAWVDSLNTGQEMPSHLQHIPVPHGLEWCGRNCAAYLYFGRQADPLCGYSPEMLPEGFTPCSSRCPGGWCSCTRSYSGRDFRS